VVAPPPRDQGDHQACAYRHSYQRVTAENETTKHEEAGDELPERESDDAARSVLDVAKDAVPHRLLLQPLHQRLRATIIFSAQALMQWLKQ
jgi:hypothetical protein